MNKKYFILMVLLAMMSVSPAVDKATFTIAPPPAGYPVFIPDTSDIGIGLNYISITVPFSYEEIVIENNLPVTNTINKDLKIVGGAITGNYKVVYGRTAVNHSGGLAVLSGNINKMLIMNFMYRLNGLIQVMKNERLSAFLFGNAGLDYSLSTSKMIFPQFMPMMTAPVEDEVTLTVNSFISSFSAGMQMNITAGNFIFSPFGVFSYSAGSFNTSMQSSMSYEYPSASGRIDGFSSIIYGFDILYTPLDMTLSSMIQSGEDYDMVNISVRKSLTSF
ncbi:MAG: hypothetical protein JXR46_02985 [Calditrichaceae bacterium]|nr:hypothetical protein [Calditrichaceae bacterium]